MYPSSAHAAAWGPAPDGAGVEAHSRLPASPPAPARLPRLPHALCVAIHDVAPATWPQCLHLLGALREIADIPLTWLVVPRYHGSAARSRACEAMLGQLLAQGHEVALHGYTHLDEAPLGLDLRKRLLRTVYTRREGEFAAIGTQEARHRLELGMALLRARQWAPQGRVAGFVAPAWLLGEPAWQALRSCRFVYTTTWSHFHLLEQGRALCAPALVYTARNAVGRALSPRAIDAAALAMRGAPLLRIALHPRDAHYPALVRHMQRLVAHLLRERAPMTKAEFAGHLAHCTLAEPGWLSAPTTAPMLRPTASDPGHSRRSSAIRNARLLPWR